MYIHFFQESLLSSCIALSIHAFGGVHVACQTFLLSSGIALSCHTASEKLFYHYSPLWEGMVFSFQNLFYHPSLLSQSMLLGGGRCCTPSFSFIIPHCPIIPYYWTNYSTLIHPFGRGLVFFFSFQSLFYHPSLLYQSMLLGGGGCCMPNFSFIILHCSVSHTTRTNTLPFLTPLGGG